MNIIIIGATSGIGKALFEKYAIEGNRIGIVGRRTHLLDELQQQHPECTITATADITKQGEVERAIHDFTKVLSICLSNSCTAISLPLRRQEDCVVNRWRLPTARLRPIKSTIWKPCAKRLSKLAEKSSSQIYAPALSILQWQKARASSG